MFLHVGEEVATLMSLGMQAQQDNKRQDTMQRQIIEILDVQGPTRYAGSDGYAYQDWSVLLDCGHKNTIRTALPSGLKHEAPTAHDFCNKCRRIGAGGKGDRIDPFEAAFVHRAWWGS